MPSKDADVFVIYMKKASTDITASLRLSDANPYSFDLKLQIDQGLGEANQIMNDFDLAISKYPNYYPLYKIVLSALQPKWGGSIVQMYEFVDRYAGKVPENSPLKLLYLQLNSDVLNYSGFACAQYNGNKDDATSCVTSVMAKNTRPDLDKQILVALHLYDKTDRSQFESALYPIFKTMLETRGGEKYTGALLQVSAEAMHSDVQVVADAANRNDYIIDLAVAESWYQNASYEHALQKNNEALRDVEQTTFPDAEQKDAAVAIIYSAMARVQLMLHNYREVIAYENTAIELGGRNNQEEFLCSPYFYLGKSSEGIVPCTRAHDINPNNFRSIYWRGRLYHELGRTNDALNDLKNVADSNSWLKEYAAIEMSVIYFAQNDVQHGLDILNTYTYLYNPNITARLNVASAYNNRCYAYMRLGELQKALDDCKASLKFGDIPDAYSKQEQLIKKLGAQKT